MDGLAFSFLSSGIAANCFRGVVIEMMGALPREIPNSEKHAVVFTPSAMKC